MSTALVVALLIPWIFWGTLMTLLFVAGRSWVQLGVIPVGITVVLLASAGLSSDRHALWASAILHLIVLVAQLGAYLAFLIRERAGRGPDGD